MKFLKQPDLIGKIAIGYLCTVGLLLSVINFLEMDFLWLSVPLIILGFPMGWIGALFDLAKNGFWMTEWESPLIIYSITLISNAYLWGLVGSRIIEKRKRIMINSNKNIERTS